MMIKKTNKKTLNNSLYHRHRLSGCWVDVRKISESSLLEQMYDDDMDANLSNIVFQEEGKKIKYMKIC